MSGADLTRSLLGLVPNTRYIVRVRSYNGVGAASDWSEAILFTTLGDTVAPKPPTNLRINFDTPDVILNWDPPTQDILGDTLQDLAHYLIKLTANAHTVEYNSPTPGFVYHYQQNVNDFVTPQPVIGVQVFAVDTSGNISAPLTGTATNTVPATPSAPLLTPGFTLISISMPVPPTVLDLKDFILQYSTDNIIWNDLATTTNDTYTQPVPDNTTRYYRFRIEDVFSQQSGWSPSASTTTFTTGGSSTPPAVPTGLSLTTGVDSTTLLPYITATWTANTEPDFAYYELRYGTVASGTLTSVIVAKGTTTATLNNLQADTAYQVGIQAFNTSGLSSAFSTYVDITTGHNTTPPATPSGFSSVSGILSIQMTWTPNTENDLAGYELYASTTSGFTPDTTGHTNRIYVGIANAYVYAVPDTSTWYFKLRSYDAYGNYSSFTVQYSAAAQAGFSRDTTAPAVPTGLAVTTGAQFVNQIQQDYATVSWTANTETDLAGYGIAYKRDSDANWATVNVPAPASTASIYNLQPNTLYDFKILAYDNSLNQSAYSVVVTATTPQDTTPPPVPSSPSATVSLKTITWIWAGVSAADFDHYDAQIATDSGFTNVIYEYLGAAISFAWIAPAYSTTYYMRVRSVNTSGYSSAWSGTASATTATVTISDLPGNPPVNATGLTLSTGIETVNLTPMVYINATWTASVTTDVAGYSLRFRNISANNSTYTNVPTSAATQHWTNLVPNISYGVSIAAYDVFGNFSPYSTEVTITSAKDTTAPGASSSITGQASLKDIIWTWATVAASDLDHYEVQASADGTFASGVTDWVGYAVSWTYQAAAYGTTYFARVRAIDTSGNASGWTNSTGVLTATITTSDFSSTPPANATGLALSTGIEFINLTPSIYVTATWTASVATDVGGYSLRIRQVSSAQGYLYTNIPSGITSQHWASLAPNTQYGVAIATYDVFGNYSQYSAETTITTAKDTTAPPAPASISGVASLKNITWSWTGVSASDLAYYEVQASDDNTFGSNVTDWTGQAISWVYTAAAYTTFYYARVRAVDTSGNASAWTNAVSPVETATITPSDLSTSAPLDATGLSLSTGISQVNLTDNIFITASWTASTSPNIAGYSLRIRQGSGPFTYTQVPSGTLNNAWNALNPNSSYGVAIAAFDAFGNYSAYSTESTITSAKDTTAPSVPTSISGSVSLRTITWTWSSVSASDFAYYEVQVSSDNTFVVGVTDWTGSAISFAYTASAYSTAYYARVRAVDTSGNASAWSTTSAGVTTAPISSGDITSTKPGVPTLNPASTGLMNLGQTVTVYVTASWNAPSTGVPAGYSVRIHKTTDTNTNYTYQNIPVGATPSNSATFTGLVANTSYSVAVAAYDLFGNYSAYTSEYTLTSYKDSTAPVAPTGLSITPGVRSLISQWTPNTETDFDHYEVHIGTANLFTPSSTTLFSTPAQSSMLTVNQYYNGSSWVNVVPGTTYYLAMYAVDVSGNKSPLSAYVSGSPAFVTNSDIVANSITGNVIIANTLSAGAITTSTLTATITNSGTIQTGTSGARLVLNSTGITGYATDGTTINFQYSTSTGSISLTGNINSGSIITGATFETNSTPTTNGIMIEDTNGFRAYNTGVLNAHIDRLGNATFTGNFTLTTSAANTAVTVGTGATVLLINSSGLGLGSSTWSTAPFRVDYSGNVTASSIALAGGTITGALNAGTGSGGRIRLGAIADTGARITLTSSWIKAFSSASTSDTTSVTFFLDATTGNTTITSGTFSSPTITSGSVTGSTFQTSSTVTSTGGIMIDASNGFRGYNSSGTLLSHIDALGNATFNSVTMTGAAGAITWTIGSGTSTFGVDGTNGMWMGASSFTGAPFQATFAGAITASNITLAGGTITGVFNSATGSGGRIRLGATTDAGARITLTPSWIKAFSSGSTSDTTSVTFFLDATTGNTTITSGTFSSPTITTATITGGTFQTSSTVTSTGGIMIDATNGFRGYNATGVLLSHIDALGNATFNSVAMTGATGAITWTIGSGTSTFGVDATNGMWLGASSYTGAPFQASFAGAITASNIALAGGTITGVLTAATGSGGKIRLGSTSDTGARVSLTPSWIKAFSSGSTNDTTGVTFFLDATTGNTTITSGTFTSPTITGGIFQTSSTVVSAGGIMIDAANGFRGFNSSGVMLSHIDANGNATFNSVTMTGALGAITWTIGTGLNTFGVDSTNGIWLGASAFTGAPFQASFGGAVTANNITLGGGLITGTFNVGTSSGGLLRLGAISAAGARVELSKSGVIGYNVGGTATFTLDATTGNLTASAATLTSASVSGNVTITSGSITIGTSPLWLSVDSNGNLWSGGATFGGAPFSVSNAGAVIAKNISIDTTAMTSTSVVFNTTSTTLTAGGTLTTVNLVANGGTIGGITIGNTALTGGTINGTTFNIANGGGINFTGSGGLTWNASATGGITVANNGFVQSGNYNATNQTGWQLGSTGLNLYQGGLTATGFSIIGTRNYVINSGFETPIAPSSGVPYNWTTFGSVAPLAAFSTDTGHFHDGTQALKVVSSASAGNVGVQQSLYMPYNLTAGTAVTVSAWFYQSAGTGRTPVLTLFTGGASPTQLGTSSSANLSLNTWSRVTYTYTIPAGTTYNQFILVAYLSATVSDTFYIDSVQFEIFGAATNYAPAPTEMPNNYLSSAWISNLNADRITSGTISTATLYIAGNGFIQSFNYATNAGYQISSSGATFQNGAITVVGAGGNVTFDTTSLRVIYGGNTIFSATASAVTLAGSIQVTSSQIQSSNYSAGAAGWMISNTGSAEFQSVTVRGTVSASAFIGGNTIGSSTANALMSSNYVPSTPVANFTATAPVSGGTLTVGQQYFYVITAMNGTESIASSAVSQTPVTSNQTIPLTWTVQSGATGYKIYRNTTNSFTSGNLLLITINGGSTANFNDTGSATTSGVPPSTAAGWAIKGDGSVEFGTGLFRGNLVAAGGTFTGQLVAASGSFSGAVTATSGTIGGWSIGSTTLTGGGVTLNSSTGAISGASISGGTITGTTLSGATGSFSGSVTASSGTIGGWSIGSSTLTGGGVTLNSSNGQIVGAAVLSGAFSTVGNYHYAAGGGGNHIELDGYNFYSDGLHSIRFYSGNASETGVASIRVTTGGFLTISGSGISGFAEPVVINAGGGNTGAIAFKFNADSGGNPLFSFGGTAGIKAIGGALQARSADGSSGVDFYCNDLYINGGLSINSSNNFYGTVVGSISCGGSFSGNLNGASGSYYGYISTGTNNLDFSYGQIRAFFASGFFNSSAIQLRYGGGGDLSDVGVHTLFYSGSSPTPSSISVKQSIEDLRETQGVSFEEVVRTSRAKHFERIGEPGKRYIGLMAEEAHDLVKADAMAPDGSLMPGVDTTAVSFVLWNALHEAFERIDALEAQLRNK